MSNAFRHYRDYTTITLLHFQPVLNTWGQPNSTKLFTSTDHFYTQYKQMPSQIAETDQQHKSHNTTHKHNLLTITTEI